MLKRLRSALKWSTVKAIWTDPVASKLIAGLIGAAALSAASYVLYPFVPVLFNAKVTPAPPIQTSSAHTPPMEPKPYTAPIEPKASTEPTTPLLQRSENPPPHIDKREVERLRMEHDALQSRFDAVSKSLSERTRGIDVKPEIAGALETTNKDLAAADRAIKENDYHSARLRMERVRSSLKFLEPL